MRRFEVILVAFFFATWGVDCLALLGLVEISGSLELGLYPLYSMAAATGWIAGNIYVPRTRRLPRELRRRFLWIYFVGPAGLIYLLRAMATEQSQQHAPLVPVYGLGVFTVLFLVPVLLKRSPRNPTFRRGDHDQDRDPPVVP